MPGLIEVGVPGDNDDGDDDDGDDDDDDDDEKDDDDEGGEEEKRGSKGKKASIPSADELDSDWSDYPGNG